jgi:hypothetical protein
MPGRRVFADPTVVEDPRDGRVIESSGCARLREERLEPLRLPTRVAQEHLDGGRRAAVAVADAPDLGEATLAETSFQDERPEGDGLVVRCVQGRGGVARVA